MGSTMGGLTFDLQPRTAHHGPRTNLFPPPFIIYSRTREAVRAKGIWHFLAQAGKRALRGHVFDSGSRQTAEEKPEPAFCHGRIIVVIIVIIIIITASTTTKPFSCIQFEKSSSHTYNSFCLGRRRERRALLGQRRTEVSFVLHLSF